MWGSRFAKLFILFWLVRLQFVPLPVGLLNPYGPPSGHPAWLTGRLELFASVKWEW